MKTALAIIAAVLLAPFFIGVICGAGLMLNLPWISRWLERRANEAAARASQPAEERKAKQLATFEKRMAALDPDELPRPLPDSRDPGRTRES